MSTGLRLQENILRARMLHIGTILNGFRDGKRPGTKANKKVDFIIEGQETELDPQHYRKNSCSPSTSIKKCGGPRYRVSRESQKGSKPETGTIRLRHIMNRAISWYAQCDGGGIDVEK
jgi:hypothetical protein